LSWADPYTLVNTAKNKKNKSQMLGIQEEDYLLTSIHCTVIPNVQLARSDWLEAEHTIPDDAISITCSRIESIRI
jgi:hypothetical protein